MSEQPKVIDTNEYRTTLCARCNEVMGDEPCEPADCVPIAILNEQPSVNLRYLNGPWRNDACKGYAIMSMRAAGLKDTLIANVIMKMDQCFDDTSVCDAASYYEQSLNMLSSALEYDATYRIEIDDLRRMQRKPIYLSYPDCPLDNEWVICYGGYKDRTVRRYINTSSGEIDEWSFLCRDVEAYSREINTSTGVN